MQTLIIYAAKAIIYSGIFFGYYCLALRNKRFHYYNRFYLLMAVSLSLLLPFLNIQLWQLHSNSQQVIKLLNVTPSGDFEATSTGRHFDFDWSDAMTILYSLVWLYLLLVLTYSIVILFRFKQKYGVEKLENINFISTDLEQAPFSFFNNLFWKNSLNINDSSGRQMFKHELTHIRQRHSWDKLFLQIITAFFWFNPVYWLLKKELALIHEFIADENAIEDKSAEAFALMILQSQYTKNIFFPAQSFHYSPIKRRLLMLTTSSRTNYSYVRRILILPLLATSVLFFAFTLKQDRTTKESLHTNAPFLLVVDAGHGGSDMGAIGLGDKAEKDINLSIAKKLADLAPEYGVAVKLTRSSDITLSLPNRVQFIKEQKPDASISIHVNNNEEKQTEKSGLDVYMTSNENMSTYQQSQLLGSSLINTVKKDFPVNNTLLQRKNHSVYVLDQNPYPIVLVECGYMNNKKDIQELTNEAGIEKMARDILQGIAAYANADKSNLSSGSLSPATTVQAGSSLDTTGKKPPLYLVDGKEKSADDIQKMDASTIQSINVLKGDDVTIKKYGEKAKNGVVLITLKSSSNSIPKQASDSKKSGFDKTAKANQLDSVLVVLDGKIIESKQLYQMSPNDIESISVWKDDEAVKKYGEKGRKGVVEVISKTISKKDSSITDNISTADIEPK